MNVTALSGSAIDVQTAIDIVKAAGGGNVYLPSGTFHWTTETVTSVGGINIFGNNEAGCTGYPSFTQNTASTILHRDTPAPFPPFFIINSSNGQPFRISGIQFEGTLTSADLDATGQPLLGQAIEIDGAAIDFRVDHNSFLNFTQDAIGIVNFSSGTTRGVCDHNFIDDPYKDVYPSSIWGYGIAAYGKANAWDADITHFLGKYETAPSGFPIIYIEDNSFARCRHAVTGNQGAWLVSRYNLIREERPQNFGSIDIHGGGSTLGARGLEAYYNTIIGSLGYDAAQPFWIRGGGGVIWNNTLQNIAYAIMLSSDGQAAMGLVKDLYIWNNNIGTAQLISMQHTPAYILGVDYFLSAPPSYMPYAYPHPLVTGAPTAPNLTISVAASVSAINVGQSVTFTATVTGGTAPAIAWFLNGLANAVGAGLTVTVPFPTAGTFTVYAIATDSTAANSPLNSNAAQIIVTAPVTTPPSKSVAARSIGPLALPTNMVHLLWRMRERWIRPEVHKKLHPLV
jgi:hypothetical protein